MAVEPQELHCVDMGVELSDCNLFECIKVIMQLTVDNHKIYESSQGWFTMVLSGI